MANTPADYTSQIGLHSSTTLTEANPIVANDPQLASRITALECQGQSTNVSEHSELLPVFEPQNDDSGVLAKRVRPNVRKVQVRGYENSTFGSARTCDCLVVRPRKVLVSNRVRVESSALEKIGSFGLKVLIDLEFHVVSSAGRSIDPSRPNSAAYARAASMSSDFIAG